MICNLKLMLIISGLVNFLFLFYVIMYWRLKMLTDAEDEAVTYSTTYTIRRNRTHIQCHDRDSTFKITQRGKFFVLNNYIQSNVLFKCDQGVTYAVHSEYPKLQNLAELVNYWDGPLSVAVHAPGSDFLPAVETILYLRKCASKKIKDLATFHLYFKNGNTPPEIPKPKKLASMKIDCLSPPPYNANITGTFAHRKSLSYPVNVGRNVARQNAVTRYVLSSEIDLVPTPDLSERFLALADVPRNDAEPRRVYALPAFEVSHASTVPENKSTLVQMIQNGTAQVFRQNSCSGCHEIPFLNEWLRMNDKTDLNVFQVAKNSFEWKPIFIGTDEEPLYDERLYLDERTDKLAQEYIMCVLDYEFHILDNAFLIHKPGNIIYENELRDEIIPEERNKQLMNKTIRTELKSLFGEGKDC